MGGKIMSTDVLITVMVQSWLVSELLINDDPQIYSIGAFNKGRLEKWLRSNENIIHDFSAQLDNISLPREDYVELVVRSDEYNIRPTDSDFCITTIPYNPEPIHLSDLRLCRRNDYCFERLHSSPSMAYALSHRFLNIVMRNQMRRCYLTSVEKDASHMDLLCAFMYREAVYLARRGYFARDMFMEHVALCSLLGYEEFNRRQWFHKVGSWIDGQGCVRENLNYDYNISSIFIKHKSMSEEEAKEAREDLREELFNDCHEHAMALFMMVMAHGIRYAAHCATQIALNEH